MARGRSRLPLAARLPLFPLVDWWQEALGAVLASRRVVAAAEGAFRFALVRLRGESGSTVLASRHSRRMRAYIHAVADFVTCGAVRDGAFVEITSRLHSTNVYCERYFLAHEGDEDGA